MRNVISLVLGGGRGARLFPLTKYRSKPAVPLAAKYRLIDIPLSNCINSGLNRIYVLTQFLSVSLHRHIRRTYNFDPFGQGFVGVLAAQQTMDDQEQKHWYQGTADAVRKNVRYIQQPGIDYVLILSGDQLYRMDFAEMLRTHEENHADVTIAALPVSSADAGGLGIMKMDATGRVTGFVEKPKTPEELATVRTDPQWLDDRGIQSRGRDCLASMGIYLFRRDLLVDIMNETNYEDFGKEVFPRSIDTQRVQAHLFDGYWEDIGTIKAFYEANLSLVSPEPPFHLTSPEAPVYTRARYLPPTRMDGATIRGSLLADGCRIGEGAVIENSIIGLRCIIGPNVTIRNSIIMGADYYESRVQLEADGSKGIPRIGIGAGSLIDGAIIDKNCHIGCNSHVVNDQNVEEADLQRNVFIRDGIPIVGKGGELCDEWKL